MISKPFLRIRVAVALVQDNQLLLVRQNNHPFWVLPGGTLESGETLKACAERELLEETGLTIAVERLLHVSEFITDTRHVVEVFFSGSILSAAKPVMSQEENLNELKFVPLTEVSKMTIEPKRVIKALLQQLNSNASPAPPVYLLENH